MDGFWMMVGALALIGVVLVVGIVRSEIGQRRADREFNRLQAGRDEEGNR